ncbi:hypothetical protein ACFW38_002592 [Salmonella enterica]|nr:hypothetical protein [Salmonella enterica]EIJ0492334.1 hypothetical protein [Salmonella enterica]EJH1666468.1 hypothetical protein [Salmonella enterica]
MVLLAAILTPGIHIDATINAAPKHGSSAVENLKIKWLATISLHFYNMGHEMRSTLKTAYGVIGVQ